MKHTYTINDVIVFDSILGTLKSVYDNETVIYINNPVSRCLELLIEKQGQVISHEDFLYYVWGRYGLNVSMNNFYQNISLLRKAIIGIGVMDEIIITVPKQGVLLPDRYSVILYSSENCELESELLSNSLTDNDISFEEGVLDKNLEDSKPEHRFTLSISQVFILKWLSLGGALTLMFFLLFRMHSNKEYDFSSRFSYVGESNDKCKLYFNRDTDDYSIHSEIVGQLAIDCGLYESGYFYLYVTAYNNSNDASIFECKKPMSEYGNICISKYYQLGR